MSFQVGKKIKSRKKNLSMTYVLIREEINLIEVVAEIITGIYLLNLVNLKTENGISMEINVVLEQPYIF